MSMMYQRKPRNLSELKLKTADTLPFRPSTMTPAKAGVIRAFGRILCTLSFLTMACACVLIPSDAYADGGVVLVETYFRDDAQYELDPSPTMPWAYEEAISVAEEQKLHPAGIYQGSFAYLLFDKNVGYANEGRDEAFIENNESKVWVEDLDGNRIEGVYAWVQQDMEYRRLINLSSDVWLKPLTTYHIVVEEGIMAANGMDMTEEPYVIEFKTSAMTPLGLTVFQIILIALIPILVITGIIAAAIKAKRRVR